MGGIGLIMLFVRPTRGRGGSYRVKGAVRGAIRICFQILIFTLQILVITQLCNNICVYYDMLQ